MKTEILTYTYPLWLSLLVVWVIGELSEKVFKRLNGIGSTSLKRFIKGCVIEVQCGKIFVGDALKYIFFLSSSFLTLQLQIITLSSPIKNNFLFVAAGMIFYVILKFWYFCHTKITNEDYIGFIRIFDGLFIDLLLIILFFFLEKSIYGNALWIILLIFFLINVSLKILDFKFIKYENSRYRREGRSVFHRLVFEFGEFIYIISLIFFVVRGFVEKIFGQFHEDISFGWQYHLKAFLCVITITIALNIIQIIWGWFLAKGAFDRHVARAKYILAPFLILIFLFQAWQMNG